MFAFRRLQTTAVNAGRRFLRYARESGPPPPRSLLLKPTCFCAAGVATCFAVSAWADYRDPSYLRRQREQIRLMKASTSLKHAGSSGELFDEIRRRWVLATDAQRTLACIAGVNVGVFLLWRIPSLQRFMVNHFIHSPLTVRYSQMLLANISHHGPVHLGLNLLALWSFGQPVYDAMGHNHFLGFVCASAFTSSWLSQVHGVVARVATGGLGLSGVVMALIAANTLVNPHHRIALVFLPQYPFDASHALMAIIAFDAIGLLLGWRLLGHAAHLGGSLFGVYYVLDGYQRFWRNRQKMVVDPLRSVLE